MSDLSSLSQHGLVCKSDRIRENVCTKVRRGITSDGPNYLGGSPGGPGEERKEDDLVSRLWSFSTQKYDGTKRDCLSCRKKGSKNLRRFNLLNTFLNLKRDRTLRR